MHPKEEEQFIPGAIDAMRRLNMAAGESRSLRQPKVTVAVKDLELLLSSTKRISGELVRYRVTTPKP